MLHRSTNDILIAFVVDLICVQVALQVAQWLRINLPFGTPIPFEPNIEILMLEAGLLYPFVFLLFSIYDPERSFRIVDEYQLISIASFIAALALAGLVYFTVRETSRLYLVYYYIIHFLLALGWRDLLRLVRSGYNGKHSTQRNVLLVGGGETARQTIEQLQAMSWAGVRLVGYLTDGEPISTDTHAVPNLGTLDRAEAVIEQEKIDDVLIAMPAEAYQKLEQLVSRLIDKACNIWLIQDFVSLLIYGSHVEDLGGVPMISLKAPALTGYQRLVKRAFDLFFGALLALLALPLSLVIAAAVRIDSKGPVIFRQKRVGENGREFFIYKFRSMVINADERLNEVVRYDEHGQMIHKSPTDPRVTRVGSILRRFSLDELPQLINVLKGEMSLVGPRPELPLLVKQYQTWQRKRFAVPPGMSGWWQVNGRSDHPMHLHTEDDLYYIQHYSLLLDLQILLKTVWVVLRGRGAY